MKSAIIVVLLLVVMGGLALSRPNQDDFKRYITTQFTQGDKNVISTGFDQIRADSYINSLTFKNRIFWTTVQKDGQTLYTGVFAHWFSRVDIKNEIGGVKNEINTAKEKIQSINVGR